MTDLTQIERVAKALFQRAVERDVVEDSLDEWEALKDEFILDARAAIKAMRKPTEAMLEACDGALKKLIDSVPAAERKDRWGFHRMTNAKLVPSVQAREKAIARWQAMIDEALR